MIDSYIEECINARHKVNVIMVNGFQMKCYIIHEYDDHIIVKCDDKKNKKMLYKHAISTIEPV